MSASLTNDIVMKTRKIIQILSLLFLFSCSEEKQGFEKCKENCIVSCQDEQIENVGSCLSSCNKSCCDIFECSKHDAGIRDSGNQCYSDCEQECKEVPDLSCYDYCINGC